MKKITILTCLSLCLTASSFASETTPVSDKPATCMTQQEAAERVSIGPVVITKIESNGATGKARIVATGREIVFVNPLFLPVSLGQTVIAEINLCDIIDPPSKTKKKTSGLVAGSDEVVSPDDSSIPYIAVIIGL